MTESDLGRVRLRLVQRERARRSYRQYLYYVHEDAWVRTRMSDFLADRVQAFLEADTGTEKTILVIETPPQHGKSMTITETLPSWIMGRFPKWRTIMVSYNDDRARLYGRKNLEKVERYGPALFGISKGSIWTKEEFERENHWGRVISRGFGGGITGNTADLLLIDDPIKSREEADSENTRNKQWSEWQDTLKTRVAPGGKVILIMTPWHEEDLSQRIIRTEPGVQVLRLPVEAEEGDLLGRAPGEPLCPELGRDAAWLASEKRSFQSDPSKGGLRTWTALYMCSPRVEGGNLLKRDWWRDYSPDQVNGYGSTIISVDAAFKGKSTSDYVAIQVWSRRYADYYLRYGINEHLSFSETVARIHQIRAKFPETAYVVIEDKANGSAIIDVLQHEMTGVVGVTPKGDKVSRVYAAQPAIEGGNVYLPMDPKGGRPLWVEEFVDQCCAFPAGKHDDMVDACSQALAFLLYRYGGDLPASEDDRLRDQIETDAREDLLGGWSGDVYGASNNFYGGADVYG